MRITGEENKVVTIARAPHDEEEVDDVEVEDDGFAEDAADAVVEEPEEEILPVDDAEE